MTTVADPNQAELRIELAVGDAIDLAPGAQVALFLDSDPLQRHLARLIRCRAIRARSLR